MGILDLLKKGKDALSEPEGAATALTAGLVFGGPVGLGLGVLQGILAKRLHQSEADKLAADAVAGEQINRDIIAQIEGANQFADTDIDKQQLGALATQRSVYSRLLNHPDEKVRQQAMTALAGVAAQGGAFLEDIEGRREAQADQAAKDREVRRGEYRTQLNAATQKADEINSESDAVLRLANELGAKNPAVQSRFRKLVEQSSGDINGEGGGAGIKIPFLGQLGKTDDYEYSYDEIVKGTAALRSALGGTYEKRAQQLAAMAQQDGFALNTKTGRVELEDLNALPPSSSRPRVQSADEAEAANAPNYKRENDAHPFGDSIGGSIVEKADSFFGAPLKNMSQSPTVNGALQRLDQWTTEWRKRHAIKRKRPSNAD